MSRACAFAETVQIEMIKREPRMAIRIDEREGRAGHFLRVNAERVSCRSETAWLSGRACVATKDFLRHSHFSMIGESV